MCHFKFHTLVPTSSSCVLLFKMLSQAVAEVECAADGNNLDLATSLMDNLDWFKLSRNERRLLKDIYDQNSGSGTAASSGSGLPSVHSSQTRAQREFEDRRAGVPVAQPVRRNRGDMQVSVSDNNSRVQLAVAVRLQSTKL